MRQIVLDTETTGLDPDDGHRVIEIGALELINRRPTGETFHRYLRPERAIDSGAIEVHGLTDEFLSDKPRFAEIADELLAWIEGAELVIHNAAFDVGFLDHEFARLEGKPAKISEHCAVLDTLALARRLHPGQRNSLDALCGRYEVDNSSRELHGALLDARILAQVYLAMTGGQATLSLEAESGADQAPQKRATAAAGRQLELAIVHASKEELAAHRARLAAIDKISSGACVWLRLDAEEAKPGQED